jgi:hypothetical protein
VDTQEQWFAGFCVGLAILFIAGGQSLQIALWFTVGINIGHSIFRKRSLKSKVTFRMQNWGIIEDKSSQNISEKLDQFADVRRFYIYLIVY